MDQFDADVPLNLVTFNGNIFYTSHNTTLCDISEARYVLDKSDRIGCTTADLLSFREERHRLCTTPIDRIVLSVMTYVGLRKVMYHLNSRPVMTFVGIDPIRVCCLHSKSPT